MYEDRIKFIEHKGRRILYEDYSNISAEQAILVLAEGNKVEEKEPVGSILSLSNYTDFHFSINYVNAVNNASKDHSKYYKASAFLGVTGLVKVMFDAASKFTKQELRIFNDKNEALDWLVSK